MGATPDPDPCADGCILESFGEEATLWFHIWASCVEKWTDPKTKQDHYNINWPAVEVVFRAYEVTDFEGGLRVVRLVTEYMTRSTLPEPVIFGFEEQFSGDAY
jgi:hypothetical protein